MSVTIRPRSSWHPDPSRGFSRSLVASQVTGVVLHYPGSAQPVGAASADRVALLLRSYRRYHIVYRGWPDIGYCYAVDQAGRVWQCAGDKVAAHSATDVDRTANHTNIGILLVVGNTEPLSDALEASLRALIAQLRGRFSRISRVRGHSQVAGASTGCPGNAARRLIATGDLLDPRKAPSTTPTDRKDDDMPALNERVTLSPATSKALNGLEHISYGGLTQYAGAGGFEAMSRLPRIEATLKAQTAALTALAKAVGADSDAIVAAVERAVTDALRGLEITLTTEEANR